MDRSVDPPKVLVRTAINNLSLGLAMVNEMIALRNGLTAQMILMAAVPQELVSPPQQSIANVSMKLPLNRHQWLHQNTLLPNQLTQKMAVALWISKIVMGLGAGQHVVNVRAAIKTLM
uniref:Uncharacterized protein n=1 Tax=Trieres chinensis TaxID=1514140 RepID=A0A7S1ZHI7_TRICV|mmetsp:Transcript_2558/g.5488  ORF Transcript_2558/g.5488 Transcript_2558/m.5488 type:complete len:118 (+) Transcript_2558:308-661(+)